MRDIRFFRFIIVALIFLACFSLEAKPEVSGAYNCFTILVGKDASSDGSVLLAHNEDDIGKNFFVNLHKVPAAKPDPYNRITLKNNGVVSQSKGAHGFLWLQIAGTEFGDTYLNEKGVVITSNGCLSREDKAVLSHGGIGIMLRRLMIERASSAREAVKIGGSLIEKYGYYSSGRSYAVADANEGWLLQVVKGKHWVAQRLQDDQVTVMANCYTIGEVDLTNTSDFMGHKDIVSYAVKRGWYKPESDGEFHFARAYSWPGNIDDEKNSLRRRRGFELLGKGKFKAKDPLPFCFTPRKKPKPADLFRVLRDHYEGTNNDLSDGYKNGSPNSTKKRTICTETTRYSFVANLRPDLPEEIAYCIWIAFRRPDSNAYSPWYVSIPSPPEGYTFDSILSPLKLHFHQPAGFFKETTEYAYWYFAKLSRLVDLDYKKRRKEAWKEWKNFEDYTLKRLKKIEKEFVHMLKNNKNIAMKLITNHVHKLEYRKWFLAQTLIRKFEKKK